ncbi:MAG TPA: extracellular solute-binding protein [Tissierellales bacterium]|nr:extracellular solute-binding protein [Tissierellales bacterium]
MATIKEVAALAGVSIGTVSNVLNGKTKNLDLINKVEIAMKELGYRPDANARSLKRDKSGLIGLILPNPINPEFTALISYIESMLYERGYSVLLNFTYDNRFIEQKSIDKCLEQRVDGIILLPVINSRKNLISSKGNVPILVVSPREDALINGDAIFLDYAHAFEETINFFKEQSLDNIGMILDGSYLYNEKLIDIYKKNYNNEYLLKFTDYSKERGFKTAFELLSDYGEIQGFIAGNYLIAEGIEKAAKLLNKENIAIVPVKNSNWIEGEGSYPSQIALSQKKVAEKIIGRIIKAIEEPKTYEPLIESVFAEFKHNRKINKGLNSTKSGSTLRLAMYDSPTSNSLKMLSQIYTQNTGINIEFDLFKYDELENIIYGITNEKNQVYDGLMMDIIWIEEVIKKGILASFGEEKINFNKFISGIEQQCGLYNGDYHTIPIMSGTQLLFYQKDLFENEQMKRYFELTYDRVLEVPSTWAEFNIVAEFFTKSFNPRSPISYGASMVSGENIYTTINYLNRLWSYGSDVFDREGNVIINNKNSYIALESLISSYKYSPTDSLNSWDEVVDFFKRGKAAMTILYDSYAMDLNDYTKSKVAGNLGVAQIPGDTPVLGGWSLGINKYSENREEMEEFISWCSGEQTVVPLLLLGGSTLQKSYYEGSELENIYPWKYDVLESYRKSRKRILPNIKIRDMGRNYLYNHVISKEIMNVLKGNLNIKEGIESIEKELNKLIKT